MENHKTMAIWIVLVAVLGAGGYQIEKHLSVDEVVDRQEYTVMLELSQDNKIYLTQEGYENVKASSTQTFLDKRAKGKKPNLEELQLLASVITFEAKKGGLFIYDFSTEDIGEMLEKITLKAIE